MTNEREFTTDSSDLPPGERDALLKRIADEIHKRRLSSAAIVFLESSKPLTFLGNQFLVFANPMVKIFYSGSVYDKMEKLLEDRSNVERLIHLLESMEEEDYRIRKQKRKEKRDAARSRKNKGDPGD